jgi:Cu-processing system ATP-binding protein
MMPLVVLGVAKRYGAIQALRGVDLRLEAGQVTALAGPNAAGKSTLIKCILGLVHPDAGRIEVMGEAVGRDPQYRRFIGYMPQLPRFPDNLRGGEVLELVGTLRERGSASVKPRAGGLPALAPGDLLSCPIHALSGGSRQKLNAMVAFRYDVPLLVLDEPTASLDPMASGTLKHLVRERRDAGAAILLTSHVMAEVEELADRLVYLVDGRVSFNGSLEELQTATGERRVERAIASLIRAAA